jgi:hypothetical protein
MMIARIPARQQLGGSENKKPAEAGQGSSLHWGRRNSAKLRYNPAWRRVEKKTAYRNGAVSPAAPHSKLVALDAVAGAIRLPAWNWSHPAAHFRALLPLASCT